MSLFSHYQFANFLHSRFDIIEFRWWHVVWLAGRPTFGVPGMIPSLRLCLIPSCVLVVLPAVIASPISSGKACSSELPQTRQSSLEAR
jgi:hypothetical protein